jgi:Tfp pilus assembly protein PilW
MTLVEIMVALAVASILLLAVATLGLYGGRSFAGLANYTDLDARSRHALDRLTKDVRQVNRLTASNTCIRPTIGPFRG